MRLFRVLSVLSLLLGARAHSFDLRDPAPHRLDVRDTLDVCGSLDTELVVPDLLGILTAVGVIDACLCQSGIPTFLETNVVAILAVTIAGEQVVGQILTQLIDSAAANSNCAYPDHSTPACVNGNPCGFECTDGFTAFPANKPTKCVCRWPSIICNGQCVVAKSCPSSRPRHGKRKERWVGSGSCTDHGPGWLACGVHGGRPRAWECIDTARDLESCGGCVLPLTAHSPTGRDCSSLPGVADVDCLFGECVVRRCLPGFLRARDGTRCIPNSQFAVCEKLW